MLKDKVVVLGVTGSISAYKAVDLASKLTQAEAKVDVVLTRSAMEFVTALSFRSLTHRPVNTDLFDIRSEESVEHVALAERADLVLIAPATANVIAKLAGGIADDMLGCTVLATRAPVVIAPAMNYNMYENQVTQENLARLKARGMVIVGPGYGRLASGAVGWGRLVETEVIIDALRQVLGRSGDLMGRKIVVSAGSTQEDLDPVRYIANRSTGKMGYAIAEAGRDRGASVVLVTAPTALRDPGGVEMVCVRTTEEMLDAVQKASRDADALIMAAAPVDFRPARFSEQKIKRGGGGLTLELESTPDILASVSGRLVRVAFAAESHNLVKNAAEKLRSKGVDFIVGNDITAPDAGFAVDTNRVVIIGRDGEVERLPLMLKTEVAHSILDRVVRLLPKG